MSGFDQPQTSCMPQSVLVFYTFVGFLGHLSELTTCQMRARTTYVNGVCTYRGALIASCLNWQNCLFYKPKLELNIYLVIQKTLWWHKVTSSKNLYIKPFPECFANPNLNSSAPVPLLLKYCRLVCFLAA